MICLYLPKNAKRLTLFLLFRPIEKKGKKMLLLLLVGHRKFKFWKESLCLRQKWWSRCLRSYYVFHLTVDISLWYFFFTRQLICFFHLALIFFFSSKSCGFQSDCLRCCLSDGLRCFVFRWLRRKTKCCMLQKTLVELESK